MSAGKSEGNGAEAEDHGDDSSVNDNEKRFLFDGINDYDFRLDGRGPLDYRSVAIELGGVNTASGSAKVRLGKSSVLAAVKISVDEPEVDAPDEGLVEFSVDNSSPTFRNDDEEDEESLTTEEIQQILECIYQESSGIDRKILCILKGAKCWSLFFDIIIFEQGTSILDAASLAVKAALYDARFPRVTIVEDELDQFEVDYSDDPHDMWQIDPSMVPIIVSLHKVGPVYLVDVTKEEQETAEAAIVVATDSKHTIYYHSTNLLGSQIGFPLNEMEDCFEVLMKVSDQVNREFSRSLHAATAR